MLLVAVGGGATVAILLPLLGVAGGRGGGGDALGGGQGGDFLVQGQDHGPHTCDGGSDLDVLSLHLGESFIHRIGGAAGCVLNRVDQALVVDVRIRLGAVGVVEARGEGGAWVGRGDGRGAGS